MHLDPGFLIVENGLVPLIHADGHAAVDFHVLRRVFLALRRLAGCLLLLTAPAASAGIRSFPFGAAALLLFLGDQLQPQHLVIAAGPEPAIARQVQLQLIILAAEHGDVAGVQFLQPVPAIVHDRADRERSVAAHVLNKALGRSGDLAFPVLLGVMHDA